jgi:hypothetical protein
MHKKLSLQGVLASLSAVPAVAQDMATVADVRCIVAGMRIAGGPASSQQSRGVFMTLYYIGKLDGRGTRNVNALIASEASKMTEVEYVAETKRCEAGLTEKGHQITQIGKDLIELEKNMQDKSAKKNR